MAFELGDKVKIKSKDQTGTICDIQKYKDGTEIVIVDCYVENGNDEYTHRVISADAKDIEKL